MVCSRVLEWEIGNHLTYPKQRKSRKKEKKNGHLADEIVTAQHYQPETVFRLFDRAIFNTDLATGTISTRGPGGHPDYATSGPESSFGIKNVLPVPPPPWACNLVDVVGTCTLEQYEALVNGTAEVVNFNVVKPAGGAAGSLAGGY